MLHPWTFKLGPPTQGLEPRRPWEQVRKAADGVRPGPEVSGRCPSRWKSGPPPPNTTNRSALGHLVCVASARVLSRKQLSRSQKRVSPHALKKPPLAPSLILLYSWQISSQASLLVTRPQQPPHPYCCQGLSPNTLDLGLPRASSFACS